jgi:D-glycero-D-manno-heptose 1,7-bisphosphate phosphatase
MTPPAPPCGTVFFDRDGTINRKAAEGEYVTSPEEFSFLPGALEGLRLLAEEDLRIIIVTNQRGIALGRMTERDLDEIHSVMLAELRSAGARVDAIYHCPHDIGVCRCRKPEVGLFVRARDEHEGITWDRSVMIGDSPADMEAAARLGMRRVLVAGGGSAGGPDVDYTADSLLDAAAWAVDAIGREAPAQVGRSS